MGETEEGPIRLYHPWNQRSVGTQRSESPIPDGYDLNHKHNYISFPILRGDGHTVPAKYVAIFMAANPYALRRLTHDGPAFTAEVHATPHFDYEEAASEGDLKELLPTWHQSGEYDSAITRLKDRGLYAEVHRYRHLAGRLAQIKEQMGLLEKEVGTLMPQRHACADRLLAAQAVRRIRTEVGQRVRQVLPWEEELSLQSNLGVRG